MHTRPADTLLDHRFSHYAGCGSCWFSLCLKGVLACMISHRPLNPLVDFPKPCLEDFGSRAQPGSSSYIQWPVKSAKHHFRTRMQEGSFFVLVQRHSAVSNWLPFRKFGSEASFTQRFDELSLGAQKICQKEVHAGVPSTPLSFSFSGAFGLALQETLEVAGGVSYRKQPSCFATKKAAVVFQGYLSNLDELVEELLYGALPEPGTSYESEFKHGALQLRSRGDQAMLSAEVLLHTFLRKRHDSSSLPILLSELQGQFAFVVYDSSKRQVFAARDASGKEPLFVNYDDEHGIAFSNKPSEAWGTSEGDWQEVSPGHYLGGKTPKQLQQFALTPHQLHMREYAESLEEMSPTPDLGFAEGVLAPVRTSTASKDGEKSPSSAHSSTELDRNVDHLFRISV